MGLGIIGDLLGAKSPANKKKLPAAPKPPKPAPPIFPVVAPKAAPVKKRGGKK
ncbi:hypothetical protein OP10G_3634 [Fimbriimonas ginsengisoli Gsoil 348]|uniref:Uncharacterized protein n=2 Tax=Fimbriimonas ginsengisoli TaxID=1005039 RepID=A0A068NUH2_FIMGI|nr:hypothetical protein OP10G_3634 [Fimbriimonas ginsengisoli Gsoil 348]